MVKNADLSAWAWQALAGVAWLRGVGRSGKQTARTIAMMPILTGNVGINGGNSGARESTYAIGTLTTRRPSPLAKCNWQHTNLVEIEKI